MPLPKPKSIADYGTIFDYLDDPEIMERHNGKSWKDLMFYRSKGASFCRDLMGVKSTVTIYRWFELMDRELKDDTRA